MNKQLLLTAVVCLTASLSSKAQQVQNGSFEEGTYISTGGTSDPVDWGTLNLDAFSLPATTTLSTADPFHSSTSVVMETINGGYSAIDPSIPDTLGGAILSDDPFSGSGTIGIPHTTRLQSFKFSYKADLVNGDTSIFVVQLTKYNAGTGNTDIVGQGFILIGDDTTNWAEVNVPIAYNSSINPDSIVYIGQSSYGSFPFYFGPKLPEPGTTFEVDAVVFCDTFAIDFDTTITERTVDFTAQTSATGNGGSGTVSWDFGDGNTSNDMNPSHEYTTNGNYTVSLTVMDSCGNDSTITKDVMIDSELSIGEHSNPANLKVYPNPADNIVNIEFHVKQQKMVSISILDITGRKVMDVYNNNSSSDQISVETKDLESGNYLIMISTQDGFKQVEKLTIR